MSLESPISRRDFLRNGALLSTAILAGSAGGIPWLKGTGVAEAALMGIGQELRDVLNLETVNRILIEALRRGGDFADIFAEQRFRTSIVLDDGKIDSVTYGYPRGAGVRVFRRRQTGYAFSDDIAYSSLLDAARVASSVVLNQSPVRPLDVTPRRIPPPFTLVAPAPLMGEPMKFDLLRRMDAAARSADPRIVSVRIEYVDEVRDVLIGTSDGAYVIDRQYLVSIVCVPTAAQGSERRNGFSSLGGRVDQDYFPRRDPEAVAREAARQAVTLLTAGPAPAGAMPVVIGPGWGGVLIHESFGHASEGDGISRGTSLLSGRIGTKIASPLLRVIDNAQWPNGRGSYAVDDEATPGQRTVLIDGGVLQSYLLDRQSAGLLSMRSTGNGRRMTYRQWPIPRMTNTYIDRGVSDPSSLLNGITKGFYAAEMAGGSVDTTSGNFNFSVRLGNLIENGQITKPVRGAILIGNSLETMMKIEGIGNDLVVEQTRGTCGKDGQMVPVGVGQPTVRFSSITVGGTAI
ncbi:MAG TPA: TldD/PmbA family protein [Candidatus Eisenbacteria bacterium]|nr:TldD/PmbA family protein [Candidatus Eisenbacteria bacterium]